MAYANPKNETKGLVNKTKGLVEEDRKNCEICKIVENGSEFKSSRNGKSSKINFQFSCNNQNILYSTTK